MLLKLQAPLQGEGEAVGAGGMSQQTLLPAGGSAFLGDTGQLHHWGLADGREARGRELQANPLVRPNDHHAGLFELDIKTRIGI